MNNNTMTVTLENLATPTEGMKLNLVDIFGGFTYIIGEQIDRELEGVADNYVAQTEKELPDEFWSDVEWDFAGLYDHFAKLGFIDALEATFPELFETGALRIDEPTIAQPNDHQGFGHETVIARVHVNPEALMKQFADDYGTSKIQIWNGHGVSGFVRTADDNRWTVVQTLKEWVDSELSKTFEGLTLNLFEHSNGLAEDFVTIPEEYLV